MLTDAELTQLRADVLETLVSTCAIYRPSSSVDSHYFAGETNGAAVATVACRLDPFTARNDIQGMLAGREANRAYFQLTVPWDADLRDGDHVTISGESLEVLQLFDIHSDRIVKRALVVKVAA